MTVLESRESNADEWLELKRMYEKWGYKLHKLEHAIDRVYNTSGELGDGTQQPTQPKNELRESERRRPNHRNTHTNLTSTPIPHTRDIFNTNRQGHTPTTEPFPSKTYETYKDRTTPLYKEYGIQAKEYEPWEFGDPPSKTPHYCNEPDLVQAACEGDHRCTELLLKNWMFVGSQYSNGVHKMWHEREVKHQEHVQEHKEHLREYEEDLCKWEEEELEFECEDLKCEELACKPPLLSPLTHHSHLPSPTKPHSDTSSLPLHTLSHLKMVSR